MIREHEGRNAAFEAIVKRRTAHRYRSEPLPEGAIERALEAANHAPCHRLTFPWRFIRVGPRSRGVLADLAVAIKAAKQPVDAEAAGRIARKILDPPELVVACQLRSPDPFQAREDYAACACAIQNFCISMAGDGVHTKWSTGALTRDPRAWEFLGVDPAVAEVIGFLWAGHADAPGPIERPPLEAVVRTMP